MNNLYGEREWKERKETALFGDGEMARALETRFPFPELPISICTSRFGMGRLGPPGADGKEILLFLHLSSSKSLYIKTVHKPIIQNTLL